MDRSYMNIVIAEKKEFIVNMINARTNECGIANKNEQRF